MNLKVIITFIAIIQIICLGSLFTIIFLNRIYLIFMKFYEKLSSKNIFETIEIQLNQNKLEIKSLKFKKVSPSILLEIISNPVLYPGNQNWQVLKKNIFLKYLLPKARARANSCLNDRKEFAARAFSLFPNFEDETYIIKLLNDTSFFIWSSALPAAIAIESKKCIYIILERQQKKHFFERSISRNLLNCASEKIFRMLLEIASSDVNPQIHLSCLKFLESKKNLPTPSFLEQDLKSTDYETRLSALKILSNSPDENLNSYLFKFAKDEHSEFRIQALKGLSHLANQEGLKYLEESLNDSVWKVRLCSAILLKNLGDPGLSILKKIDSDINKQMFQTAEYVFQFEQ